MFDLDAYLERIGLRGRPSVSEVHRAHVTSIPFENLDPYCGVPVSLAVDDLERKLVGGRRGGYCFEQNLLLKAGLEALGANVDLLLARVRVGAAPGVTRPRTHLVLRVHADGAVWHADAGFGLGTLLEPLPFGAGREHEQVGWWFRIVDEHSELVLQTRDGQEWADLYSFTPQPVPFVDVETSNWFTSTHPRSPFVTGIIVSEHRADGGRSMLRDWGSGLALREQTPAQSTLTAVALDAVPELLATRFGLSGYAVDADEALIRRAAGAANVT